MLETLKEGHIVVYDSVSTALVDVGRRASPGWSKGHRPSPSIFIWSWGYSPRTACRTRMDGLRTTCSRELGSPAGKGSLMAATAIVPESLMGVDGRPDGEGKLQRAVTTKR